MLEVKKLCFWYHTSESPIVYNCDFSVADGEFVGIVGSSGSGKSTLLRLTCGLLRGRCDAPIKHLNCMKGEVLYDSKSDELGPQAIQGPHKNFGYVPQNFQISLLPAFTAIQNIQLAVKSGGINNEEEKTIAQLLNVTGISDVSHLRIQHLSGGQQQRVAICRALVTQPSMLFMDEPFANLDPMIKPRMADMLIELRRGTTRRNLALLLVTHDIENAVYLADTIIGVRRSYGRPMYQCFDTKDLNLEERIAKRREIESWIG